MEGFCLICHACLFQTVTEYLHIIRIEHTCVFLYFVIIRIGLELSALMTDDRHGAFINGFVEIQR